MCWTDFLKKAPQFPQRQDSLIDQLYDLVYVANKFGFYDAADFLRSTIACRHKDTKNEK